MRCLRYVPVCCFLATALACGGFGRVYERRMVENLGLSGLDTMGQMALVEFDDDGGARRMIPPTVFAVGWDEAHVIAKRHPSEEGSRIDRTRTEYYIVVVRGRQVHGPFDAAEFRERCRALKVAEGIGFTLTFSELE